MIGAWCEIIEICSHIEGDAVAIEEGDIEGDASGVG